MIFDPRVAFRDALHKGTLSDLILDFDNFDLI